MLWRGLQHAVGVKRISNLHNFGLIHQYSGQFIPNYDDDDDTGNDHNTDRLCSWYKNNSDEMMMTTFQLGQSMIPLLSQSAQ